MNRIDPTVLKQLMTDRGLSLSDLAQRARIDKQTLWRHSSGKVSKSRQRTVEQLAKVLKVDPRVLTGDLPLQSVSRTSEPSAERTQFNMRVDPAARNALILVAERYLVPQWLIIEMAPFLFYWAAETSLRKRSARLSKIEHARQMANALEREIMHFGSPDPDLSGQRIEAERKSIEYQDLFGVLGDDDDQLGTGRDYNDGYDNPFAQFLGEMAAELGDDVSFEHCSQYEPPNYRVCRAAVAELAEDVERRIDFVFNGFVSLADMPKEIRDSFRQKVEWIRLKTEETEKEMIESFQKHAQEKEK
jgi:transcriptional regulator with XRE-family HTH domain